MKKTAILFVLAAMIGCNNAGNKETANAPKADSPAVAAKPETPPPPPMDSATMMKKYQEYMTPGEMHKMLASWDGKWTTESTFWMDEKAPPSKSTGSCENKMILGGRYQQSIHTSSMMGQPFEGVGMTGYDNGKKVFVSTWQDNMGTGIMYLEGPYDTATKTMTLKGSYVDPVKGKTDVRQTFKIVDDKNQYMEMYGTTAGGKEMKWMEMKLVKK